MTTLQEIESEKWDQYGTKIHIENEVLGLIYNPGRCQRAVLCVNALRGVPSKYLQSGRTTIHVDLTKQGEAYYMMQGSKDDIILFAKELLRDEGYSVFDPCEDTFLEE